MIKAPEIPYLTIFKKMWGEFIGWLNVVQMFFAAESEF
tara:strand:- start:158 stop:271 length:114 start_codon:yes stop_codon:yes gene_type:complete